MGTTRDAALAARAASLLLAATPASDKDAALLRVADALEAHSAEIARANAGDLAQAVDAGLPDPILQRLKFDAAKISAAATGVRSLAALPDPVGRTLLSTELDEGLDLYRVTCPLGVVGVVFESRPDALVQIACLCLKSGNAALLKGGAEALGTNRAVAAVMAEASRGEGIPDGWFTLLETRSDVGELLEMDDLVDLVVPRGSNAFVRYIMDHTRIPVLGHADGICHVYADRSCDPAMAVRVMVDAKTQYVSVCNAAETFLVHADAAPSLLPPLMAALADRGVAVVGCPRTVAATGCLAATEEDWSTEYLDRKVSIRIVDDLDAAIAHVNRYGSKHTDAIVAEDREAAARFLERVDSGNVFWNCSTRFSDGFRYGFGAEVGVSTSKIHARGPVGLEGLVTYKYKLLGHGQVVDDYASGRRRFLHRKSGDPCPM
jgi:glutamate-5-semialdehyde dehydrogenase